MGRGRKAAKGTAKSKSPAAPHDTTSMIQADLKALHFAAIPNIHQTIKGLTERAAEGLRPGPGLIGNAEEERKLYGDKDEEQMGGACSEENKDEKMGTAESSGVCKNSGTGDIEMADVQNLDAESQVVEEQTGGASLMVHSPPTGKVCDVEGEDIGEYEKEEFGHDFVQLPDGKVIPIWEYLGPKWDARIEELYSIEPLEMPDNMRIIPRDFQRKVAAQGLHCLRGPNRLFLLGDEMGVGKTLSSILMMWAMKDLPGMSIVICPKNLCETWLETIQNAFDDGHALQAFILDDSNITQASLLARGDDIVICSYEFFEANGREMHTFHARVEEKANDQEDMVVMPRRPTSALHSEMWQILGMPFKIAVLDEAQRVNKRGKIRHEALKHLHASSFLIVSGTLPHNKWYDISGYLAFGQNHPFTTHNKFLHTFSSFDQSHQIDRPSAEKLRLLQKFLQALLIARPARILDLKGCENRLVTFKLQDREANVANNLTANYKLVAGIQDGVPSIDPADSSNGGVFGMAVTALVASMHPMLAEAYDKKQLQLVDFNEGGLHEGLQNMVKDDLGGEARDQWLQDVSNRADLVLESGRLTVLMRLYKWLRETYPDEKMIIFSSFLRFLDIVSDALRREHSIHALRFDGTVPSSKRKAVELAFASCAPECPLLITMNAGGVGLNLQPGSIVIICEPQWNNNAVLQAIARAYRQGQTNVVKAMMICAGNSDIDSIVMNTSRRKQHVNAELMGCLLRTPDEGPARISLLTFPGFLPMEEDI